MLHTINNIVSCFIGWTLTCILMLLNSFFWSCIVMSIQKTNVQKQSMKQWLLERKHLCHWIMQEVALMKRSTDCSNLEILPKCHGKCQENWENFRRIIFFLEVSDQDIKCMLLYFMLNMLYSMIYWIDTGEQKFETPQFFSISLSKSLQSLLMLLLPNLCCFLS